MMDGRGEEEEKNGSNDSKSHLKQPIFSRVKKENSQEREQSKQESEQQ
jgi:hypothetical protein